MKVTNNITEGVLKVIILPFALLLASCAGTQTPAKHTSTEVSKTTKQTLLVTYGKLPLSFEANFGQTDEQVNFLSRGNGYTLFLTPTEAVLALRKPQDRRSAASPKPTVERERAETTNVTVLRMKLIGANPAPSVVGLEVLPGKSNYFIGNDPQKWRTNVPHYAQVRYKDVYSGVDLVFYGNRGQLEYDFVVAPGADPDVIKLAFEGADRVEVDPQGDMVLHVAGGQVHLRKPSVYQEVDGVRREISGSYVLLPAPDPRSPTPKQVGFHVAAYDTGRPLVIDPVLVYSTYLGGSGNDSADGIAVDAAGNAYVTGYTFSVNFPTTGPLQAASGGGQDAFIAKLNPTGSSLLYSTYLGGSGADQGFGVATDCTGSVYVAGYTESNDFPTRTPLQPAHAGGGDGFVAKLNADGTILLYSTYLGGSGNDQVYGIALDPGGNAYVAGITLSTNFPTMNALQQTKGAGEDGFVAKLDASGSALVYSTYIGGSGHEFVYRIAVDSVRNAYLAGNTRSTDFPTVNPLQPANGGGMDAFVAKLNAAGSAFVYSTYLGGSLQDRAFDIAVDSTGNAYVSGLTESTNFPTLNPLQPTNGGGQDIFVAKLNAAGSALLYSTYLGGSSGEFIGRMAVDSTGNAYVTGSTLSTNFPSVNAIQSSNAGGETGVVAKVDASGSALIYSTYLGGSGYDVGFAIAVDSAGNAYVAGVTESTNFPLANPLQSTIAGLKDVFVTKIADTLQVALQVAIDIKPGSFPNSINPKSRGRIPVAILSSGTFDAPSQVDQGTLTFGHTGDEPSLAFCNTSPEDVNSDGFLDLVCHFHTLTANFQPGDIQGILKGKNTSGTAITGTDSVRIVP